jgi:hypothetical protein
MFESLKVLLTNGSNQIPLALEEYALKILIIGGTIE